MEVSPFPISVYSSSRCLYLVGKLPKHRKNREGLPLYEIIEVSSRGNKRAGEEKEKEIKSVSPVLNLHQHDQVYTRNEATEYIKADAGGGGNGASCVYDRVYCIFGFVPLMLTYQMICVTGVDVVATIHGHDIYSARCTSLVQVPMCQSTIDMAQRTTDVNQKVFQEQQYEVDDKYKSLLAAVVDLSHSGASSGGTGSGMGWYFSYTYDLTSSLQRQQQISSSLGLNNIQYRFLWNAYSSDPLRQLASRSRSKASSAEECVCSWFVPFIQGFVSQKTSEVPQVASVSSTTVMGPDQQQSSAPLLIKCTLVARRSCHFAGARYLRRGIDNKGNCANEVETEQIISVRSCVPAFVPISARGKETQKQQMQYQYHTSSIVLLRASVPLYWHNIDLLSLQPGIEIEKENVKDVGTLESYVPSRRHFQDLQKRYCTPQAQSSPGAIHILNLIKLKGSKREIILGRGFRNMLQYLVPDIVFSHAEKVVDKKNATADGKAAKAIKTLEEIENDIFTDISSLDGGSCASSDSDTDTELGGVELTEADNLQQQASARWLTYQAFDLLSYHDAEEEIPSDGSPREGSLGMGADSRRPTSKRTSTVLHPFINRAILNDIKDKSQKVGSPSLPMFNVLDGYSRTCLSETLHFVVAINVDCANDAILSSNILQLQRGIFRANCVDCLDRTNIAQFTYAKEALPLQCESLGVSLSPTDLANFNLALMDMWTRHGNFLALQYGGSDAMHMLSVENAPLSGAYGAESEADSSADKIIRQTFALTGGIKNILVAANRYVANVSSDYAKQQGIDLLHGAFVPVALPRNMLQPAALWDMKIQPECVRSGYKGNVFSYEDVNVEYSAADATLSDSEYKRHQAGRITFERTPKGDFSTFPARRTGCDPPVDDESWGELINLALGKGYFW